MSNQRSTDIPKTGEHYPQEKKEEPQSQPEVQKL
jgi:hypothetical protein